MNKCDFCGIGEDQALLQEGVSKNGIVHVCRKCSFKTDVPLIEKKNLSKINFNDREKVRERLLKLSKIKKEDYNPESSLKPRMRNLDDLSLKKIVEENFKKNLPAQKVVYDDLIPNFHWTIMRVRRIKKVPKEQFAKEIFEPIVAIESLERGILPKDYGHLIKKVENYLGIPLFRDKAVNFDPAKLLIESKLSNATVSDFKKVAEREKFDADLDKKEINPEDITMEKIEEVAGVPIDDLSKKKKRNFFSWFFWFKKTNKQIPVAEEIAEEKIDEKPVEVKKEIVRPRKVRPKDY